MSSLLDRLCDAAGEGTLDQSRLDAFLETLPMTIDCLDRSGQTALHAAVRGQQASVVTMLLRAGASPNVLDSDGETPVFACAFNGTAQIMAELLRAKGDVHVLTPAGCPLLCVLCRSGNGDALERLRILLAVDTIDVDELYLENTAEQWARLGGRLLLAEAIAAEVC